MECVRHHNPVASPPLASAGRTRGPLRASTGVVLASTVTGFGYLTMWMVVFIAATLPALSAANTV
jgi:hypothetical protein